MNNFLSLDPSDLQKLNQFYIVFVQLGYGYVLAISTNIKLFS
jgi:hypothetical protein